MKNFRKITTPLLMALCTAPAAQAAVELAAIGTLGSAASDLSTETAGALESGVPGNVLGGVGSGLGYAGGGVFLAVPDRGPNANAYNSNVDNTTSYIDRFHTLDLSLSTSTSGSLPLSVTPVLRRTTLLASATPLVYGSGAGLGLPSGAPALNASSGKQYFTGRSDNFDASKPSANPDNARFDPESLRVSADGQSVFISDEYGPYVYQFDRETGVRLKSFALPAKFSASNLSPRGDVEISGNTAGRVANRGMEGLAISPDGRSLFGVVQSPLIQDGGLSAPYIRIIKIDIASGATTEYAYPLDNIGTAAAPRYPSVSEIVAVNDHQFLLDERDGRGFGDDSRALIKRVYLIDIASAEDVSAITGQVALAPKAVAKTLFVDLVAKLSAFGLNTRDIPAKLEGLAFGPDVVVGGNTKHTLFVSNDNDFISTVVDGGHPAPGRANPNVFYVFTFDAADLPGYTPQQFVAGVVNAHLGTPTITASSTSNTPVTDGPAGVYSFNARVCNQQQSGLAGLYSRTLQLTNGNTLLSRSRGAATGAGSEQDFSLVGAYADGILATGECTDVPYRIGLRNKSRFTFTVDFLGSLTP